ncbi:MAG: cation:proton antiporter [Armatimonadota bacterium]|nr:cation:proton antiporter [Armatimonadota bacterium]MDR7457182.1 cation:proton antiporter [Armatimonadota bacterium]MDR7497632.1 cation:proton antiporter [Armatimonadota bacterium]
MNEAAFFRDLTLLLVAAVAGGGLAQFLRQPAFVGYILGGLVVTALTGPAVSAAGTFELFAELGVVLLMFALGVEFSLRELWRVRGLAVLGAPLGMAAVTALATGLLVARGVSVVPASVTGLALAVCSTMALAKLLAERGDLAGPVGRASIGISLAQDLVVVAAIFFIPTLAGGEAAPPGGFLYALLRGAIVLVPFFLLANRFVPALLGRIAHARNTELFVLVAVAIGAGMAALSAGLGLTVALGAFLAGLVISESDYTVETLARVLPLRDVFVAVFFVSVGMLIDVRTLATRPDLLLAMLGIVLIGKALVWTAVALLFRQPLPVAAAVGLGQTQIGEFSFVIAQLGYASGLFGLELYSAVLATSLLTLLTNALVFRRSRPLERWADRWAQPAEGAPLAVAPSVLIVGYGRVGSAIGEALETFAIPFAVVDFNPAVIQALRRRSIPAVLGDAANDHALRAAGAAAARLAVLAVPDSVKATLALARLRQINPSLTALARAHTADERERLLAAGATEVILPEAEAGMTLVDHALHRLEVPSADVRAYLRQLRGLERPGARVAEVPARIDLPGLAVVEVADGALAHQSLRRARVRERTGVTVVGVERRGEDPHWNPPPDAVLAPGDRVTVFGLPEQIERFRRLAAGDED